MYAQRGRQPAISRITILAVSVVILAAGASEAARPLLSLIDCRDQGLFLSRTPPEDGGIEFLGAGSIVPGGPKQIDSPALSRSNGNQWKEIGIGWFAVLRDDVDCVLAGAEPLTLWIGLKNSDDQGTSFDVKAELHTLEAFPQPVAVGETRCIRGVTRQPARARLTLVPFDVVDAGTNVKAETLTLRLFARIGTLDSAPCPGHGSAVGLRVYFAGAREASGFVIRLDGTSAP